MDDEVRVSAPAERTVLESGLAQLRALLPGGWRVEHVAEPRTADTYADAVVSVMDSLGAGARLVVEVKTRFTPRDAENLLGGQLLRLLRQVDPQSRVLVVAPWMSPRTQVRLAEGGINFLDLTGNVGIQLERPAALVRTTGASHDPTPPPASAVSMRGVMAGRVVRLLVDVRPPYTPSDIARASGASVPYVSRLLTALDGEALIERGPRGVVLKVDWSGLLSRRAETYQLFGTNTARGYLSPTGARNAVRELAELPAVAYRAVTGSFAASQRAPVAAPTQLVLYVDDFEAIATPLGLLPADEGADVVLLQPYDFVVTDRLDRVDNLRVVAPSQLALDCLSGNGRMPAEGQALLGWMDEHQSLWRQDSLTSADIGGEVFL